MAGLKPRQPEFRSRLGARFIHSGAASCEEAVFRRSWADPLGMGPSLARQPWADIGIRSLSAHSRIRLSEPRPSRVASRDRHSKGPIKPHCVSLKSAWNVWSSVVSHSFWMSHSSVEPPHRPLHCTPKPVQTWPAPPRNWLRHCPYMVRLAQIWSTWPNKPPPGTPPRA